MLIISQNLTNYELDIPQDVIFRINLAWINNLKELKAILEKHRTRKIFLDLPANRTKPPNNKYSIDELAPIIKSNQNIKYFAVSNINSTDDLEMYVDIIPENVILVPKIESVEGISNIKQITDALGTNKIIMFDHDDLYSSIIKSKQSISKFLEYFNKLVEYCKNNNIKGYILDLRNNPGGLLTQAIKISDFFLDNGEIVSTKGRKSSENRKWFAKKGDIINGKSLIVLINYGSASAAEIVAGALKDHKRAILIGENSFGKGSVQSIIPLKNRGAIRLTISKYYLPSGQSITEVGVTPDIEVAEDSEEFKMNTKTDNQLNFALKLLNG